MGMLHALCLMLTSVNWLRHRTWRRSINDDLWRNCHLSWLVGLGKIAGCSLSLSSPVTDKGDDGKKDDKEEDKDSKVYQR